ncbi:hypothetical protein KQI49_03675 [Virgibacillus sp. MSJ-26]|uniref:hypothetical protein n=1 Tax=Virgibacillus sp. MSJ-26 TaxID=2841522 RepID=UPI001C0FFB5A|nr:hypothetical protein [Virgibacillus sp. MSJ-26]MBU5465926.1 hypothetical protein [Virgibacillus sp. MSJ-26]
MIDRKALHRLVDELPEEKLPRIGDFFRHLFDEEELKLNDETKKDLGYFVENIKRMVGFNVYNRRSN